MDFESNPGIETSKRRDMLDLLKVVGTTFPLFMVIFLIWHEKGMKQKTSSRKNSKSWGSDISQKQGVRKNLRKVLKEFYISKC